MRRMGKMGSKKGSVEMKFWTRGEYLQFRRQVMDKPISFLAFEVLYWTGIREGDSHPRPALQPREPVHRTRLFRSCQTGACLE